MNKLAYIVLIAFIAVFSLNCQKEIKGPAGQPVQPDLPSPIISNIQGTIFDENEQPASGVSVKIGSKTATTNTKGYFRINAASLDKLNSLLIAEKAGYFKGIRHFQATSGTNNIQLKLIKKNTAGTIDAVSGGNVSLPNGAKISLPANAVVNAQTNTAYIGAVTVYAAYIDPTAADIVATVPGSFSATDKNNKRVVLTSYGMMAVELASASGDKLQIATGKTASLTTPIPATRQASAAASIPLWYLDETTGIWKEEGSATKNGNAYVGEVKHFSFWNCDFPGARVTLTAKFLKPSGEPLTGVFVRVRPASGFTNEWHAGGWADTLGQVSGEIPAGQELILEVLNYWQSGFCNYIMYTQNIGSNTAPLNLGTITIHPSMADQLTIKGKLVNCSGVPLANAMAAIYYGYFLRYIETDANGNFSQTTWECNPSPQTVEIYGMSQSEQSATLILPIQFPVTDAGTIAVCGISTDQFVNYTVDGTNYSHTSTAGDFFNGYKFTTQPGSSFPYTSWITSSTQSAPNSIFQLYLDHDAATGVYPLTDLNVRQYNQVRLFTPINVTLTNYPAAIGNYYEGSLTGQFKDSSDLNQTHTINASFRVKRIF